MSAVFLDLVPTHGACASLLQGLAPVVDLILSGGDDLFYVYPKINNLLNIYYAKLCVLFPKRALKTFRVPQCRMRFC